MRSGQAISAKDLNQRNRNFRRLDEAPRLAYPLAGLVEGTRTMVHDTYIVVEYSLNSEAVRGK